MPEIISVLEVGLDVDRLGVVGREPYLVDHDVGVA